MDSWIKLRTAYQLAQLGTVSAAAEALGVHRATVNRHVDALEAELGKKLFQRHSRGYLLTDAGHEFLRVAQKVDEMFVEFAGRTHARSSDTKGEIVLSVHSALAGLVMRPITAFREIYPAVHVRLVAQDALARLEYAEAHVSLYGGAKPEVPDYVVQRFKHFRVGLYAHADYVARNGLPASFDEFADHDFVTHSPVDKLRFEIWFAKYVPRERIAVTSSHPRVTHEAIVGGVGIGFLPESYVQSRSDLHEVAAPRDSWTGDLWLVTHMDLHHNEMVQAMLRCIKDAHSS
ncbi:MAG: LysR family transcriptional regulator [Pseudomonadota bacterium]